MSALDMRLFWDLNTSLFINCDINDISSLFGYWGTIFYGCPKGPTQKLKTRRTNQNINKLKSLTRIKKEKAKWKPNINKLKSVTQRKNHLIKKIEYRKQKSITEAKRYITNKKSSTRWAKKHKANKHHAAPVRNSVKRMKFCTTNLVSSENTS